MFTDCSVTQCSHNSNEILEEFNKAYERWPFLQSVRLRLGFTHSGFMNVKKAVLRNDCKATPHRPFRFAHGGHNVLSCSLDNNTIQNRQLPDRLTAVLLAAIPGPQQLTWLRGRGVDPVPAREPQATTGHEQGREGTEANGDDA
ncbi:Uncharacterized protein OBRU01_11801 [Operophtera brumata]|uniref:Uncharacterized protein n=1 Tax=Operophtera brumata TaxID=104452 RepID=A0A0L7LBK4_OPEBR|nr:Uncharacterized protein OBRU01_11801 [Operophtera brumata]